MLNVIMSAAFKNVQITNQIGISISERIFQRVANAGLGSKVDHPVKFLMSKKLGNTFTIRQIDFMKTEQGGIATNPAGPASD